MEDQSTKRVRILARSLLFWVAIIVARLFFLQVLHHDELLRLAEAQQRKDIEIPAPRGRVLDRGGQPLAMSLPVDSVCINPLRVPDLGVASDVLAKVLQLDSGELLLKMQYAVDAGRGFMWVKRRVTPEESDRLRGLKLEWIEFRTESRRFYPYNALAAHVIGSVDFAERGNSGIEQSLNDDLEGHPGTLRMTTDVRQHGFQSQVANEALAGRDLKLTIDSRVQFIAERELKNAVLAHHCKTGSLVAMNPKTGEILALANYPSFDPNDPGKPQGELDGHANLAVQTPFEPGSVFKVITLTAALETTNLRPESIIPCGSGSMNLFGRVIHDHGHYASLPMEDVLARSSNIGAINVGLRVGDQKMYEYVRRFGFGGRTGLSLPGESTGQVRPVKKWQKSSIGSVAMGHEISATTVQLAQACSAIANGGFLVKPRLVADAPKTEPKRIMRPETAITMRQMMEGVVIKPYGTGHRNARIPGYTSGGKTGTAQIFDLRTHQYTHFYNASFMGFAPVKDPAIVVVVTVNGATGLAGYGGTASAPVFREVAHAALRMMDIPKDLPDTLDLSNDGKADENDLAIAGLSSVPPPLAEDAEAATETPRSADSAAPGQRAFFQAPKLIGPVLEPIRSGGGPKVPDLQGKSMRAVVQQCASLGLPVEFIGNGLVRAQFPLPGYELQAGERLRVQFGR